MRRTSKKTSGLSRFMDQFNFKPKNALMVGVEREAFLCKRWEETRGNIWSGTPHYVELQRICAEAERALRHLRRKPLTQCLASAFGYELSACQIETRTPPCDISHVEETLRFLDKYLRTNLREINLEPFYSEVASRKISLKVYPDARYERLATALPRNVLRAACRVIGTHVHVGVGDHEEAMRVYNYVAPRWQALAKAGDGSNGRRLKIYREMQPDLEPEPYRGWGDFYEHALRDGFSENPRNNWKLVRISKHGTIEFRMFGATESISKITSWARRCHAMCELALYPTQNQEERV